jgi:lactoylglutathione lyase
MTPLANPDKTHYPEPNVTQAVPFFWIRNMEASLRFYTDGLGFKISNKWIDNGHLRWCSLQLGGASIMLQEYSPGKLPSTKRGEGITICFQCKDAIAIYHGALARSLTPQRPFVGNALWVTSLTDPDGYKLEFSSPTDAPEESLYEDQPPKQANPSLPSA